MIHVAHRINTIEELSQLQDDIAIEFDIRDRCEQLIVQHDPYKNGICFEDFLPYLKNRFLIVNIKSEGIEYKVLDLLKKYNITTFFLLDCTIPMIYKLSNKGEKRIAVRFSEFENLDSVLQWKDRVEWVWVDCFHSYILTKESEKMLHENGFKLCLVSPELQGRLEEINLYKNKLISENIKVDAICTKYRNFELWNL
jgi:hypothetical protein